MAMNVAIKWSDESTRDFIQLRYKLRHLFNGRKHQCENAYGRIVDELGLRNVISPIQARKKWSNLLQKYMDIKGGYSTASPEWPYFQMLDQIVPLIRKEKIEKRSRSEIDSRESDRLDSQPTDPLETEAFAMPGLQEAVASEKGKADMTETGEPPRKRGRGRRAAQRARDRWWGAVEDNDFGTDVLASTELPTESSYKSVDSLAPSQMELQTVSMLESCSSALTEIRDILKTHTDRQEKFMQSLQETVTSQSSTVKEVLNTVSSQNATLITLLTQLTTKNSQPHLGMSSSDSFGEDKLTSEQPAHRQQEGRLLTSDQTLISALSRRHQGCESHLEATGINNSISGL